MTGRVYHYPHQNTVHSPKDSPSLVRAHVSGVAECSGSFFLSQDRPRHFGGDTKIDSEKPNSDKICFAGSLKQGGTR